jgi:hypothetical protein
MIQSRLDLAGADMSRSHFQSDLYVRHNARRLEHLAALHLDLANKSVLELGAGIGDHSIFYLDRGCTVTAVEARAENVLVLQERMRDYPEAWDPGRLTVMHAPVERLGGQDGLARYDVVHCYGLLYHVADPRAVLTAAAQHCSGLFLLETKVRLADRSPVLEEDRHNPTNAVDGRVTLMTRDELLAHLAVLFSYVYVPHVPVAHEQFPADWDRVPADQWPIRTVIVASRSKLSNPLLRQYEPGRPLAP